MAGQKELWTFWYGDEPAVLKDIKAEAIFGKHQYCCLCSNLLVKALKDGTVALSVECWTCDHEVVGSSLALARGKKTGQVSHTYVPLSPSSISWHTGGTRRE